MESHDTMMKLLLTPDEAARMIGVGRTKMYALLASGIVPSVRIGKALRVPVTELQEWIERKMRR
jgi:excisionase family DNA binding protein